MANLSRQDFIESTPDNKLLHMFDKLRYIRNEQSNCSKNLEEFQKSLIQVDQKIGQVITVTNSQTELLRAVAYKSIDARSRRNNLIFRGITETREEDCFAVIADFLESKLDVNSRDVYMARAHRLGKRVQGKNFNKRPIIVNFRDYGDISYVMSKVSRLKKTIRVFQLTMTTQRKFKVQDLDSGHC
ncbi:hypothetical protein DPMN_086222 [Dreissena polymorpha]|uniref:Uncharacterized protein n=1 Tax=Dreissena polymorpha TaxID=45954 RepID=A0A9D4BDI0_DREPO|nr:hypothetical protein DPMN_086222 [Dreissena polymorpha]